MNDIIPFIIDVFFIINAHYTLFAVVIAHSTCPTYVADFSTGEKCYKIGRFFISGISPTEHNPFGFSFLIKLLTEVGVLKIEIHLVCFADELFDCSHSMLVLTKLWYRLQGFGICLRAAF